MGGCDTLSSVLPPCRSLTTFISCRRALCCQISVTMAQFQPISPSPSRDRG